MSWKRPFTTALGSVMVTSLFGLAYADQEKSIFELGAAAAKHPQTHRSKGEKM